MTFNLNRRRALAGGVGLGFASLIGCSPKPTEAAAPAETNVVETPYGKVRGFEVDGVRTFRGVNYGADTSGKNRFMPPVKPAPWTGIKEATAYGLQAPQLRIAGQLTPKWLGFCFPAEGGAATGEDCLVLNVWTPGTDNAKRPVMVWFHGGGYTVGSSHGIAYDGASLARTHDVVVVGVNHRLHAFGFTDIGSVLGGDYARAGNAGIMDCVAALEWVRESIERFGGDPNRVMIFGESGGGAKVSNLLAMPSAKGLFHRAAIESGAGLRTGNRERTQPLAEAMLKELGVTKDNVGRLAELTTAEVEAAALKVGATRLAQTFGPTNDGDVVVRNPFDPDAPDVSADVPIIVGYNRTEQTLFSPENDPVFNLDDKGLKAQFVEAMGKDTDKVIKAYREKFPEATPSDLFFTIATETRFAPAHRTLAERKAAKGGAPAYHYRFDWASPSEGGKWRSAHTVEIPFVFNNMAGEAIEYSFQPDDSTRELARRVSGMWATFAATGVPAFEGMPEWTPYNGQTRPTLLINLASQMENDPLGELHRITPAIPSRF